MKKKVHSVYAEHHTKLAWLNKQVTN